MAKIIKMLATIMLIVVLTACTAANSITTVDSAAGTTAGSSTTSITTSATVTGGAAAADVLAENAQTHAAAGSAGYNASAAAKIILNGGSITAQESGVTVEGSVATITAAGTYTISGSLTDGQIVVNTQAEETVFLVLDGVNITSSNSAPIYIADAEQVEIVLADQTQNTLTDGANYVYALPEEEEPNAAIFSNADLTISGGGALAVNANFNDGINSDDGLIISSGSITVNAVDDGIRGKDYLVVKDGSITLNVQGDGLKSDNEEDAALGYISLVNGTYQISAGGDAVNAQTDVVITGGVYTLTTGGGSQNTVSADASAKAIKGGVSVTIEGGTFTLDAADDGLHANGAITINGGAFNIASADDGVHADQNLTINNGEFTITRSYEGLESAQIIINNGTFHITASDDGINVAGGVDSSGMGFGGPGGGPGQDVFSGAGDYYLSIQGGYLYVDAYGDGLDANGAIMMSGGVVIVNGPTEQMNGALDYDAGFNLTGGTFVAVGSSGMAQMPDASSTQPSVMVFLTSTQPAGTLVNIQNAAGESILTFAPTKAYQSIAFSLPELVQGQTYTVSTGGSATGSAVDGLYQDAAYSGGSQVGNFTVSSVNTTLGTGGGRGPGGGRQRP